MSENTKTKIHLITKYQAECMLGGRITSYNPLQMHHIVSKFDGGKTNVENGSLCACLEHSALHTITHDDRTKKQKFIKYLKELKHDLDKMRNVDDQTKNMNDFLHIRMLEMEFEIIYTKSNTKIFKRRRNIK